MKCTVKEVMKIFMKHARGQQKIDQSLNYEFQVILMEQMKPLVHDVKNKRTKI